LWNLRQCSWPTSTLPHSDAEELCVLLYARSLGVDRKTPVVIYDRTNMQVDRDGHALCFDRQESHEIPPRE